jgi:phosphatidylserine decarboxylase
MSLIASLRMVLAPPHRAGYAFLAGGVGVALAGVVIAPAWHPAHWLIWLGVIFTLFCLFFFRDPTRVAPGRPGLVLAPADGRVVSVGLAVPPEELGLGPAPRLRVAIFLSVLDVHVNRMPVDGVVTRIAYRAGAFVNASLDKASTDNERNALAVRLADGRALAVVQIAGLIARRIICDTREGESVRAGARFGLIRFGSRTDTYLPEGIVPLVAVGQTMIGGETVLAELGSPPPGGASG